LSSVVDNNERIAGSCWLHLRGTAEYNASDHNVTLLQSAIQSLRKQLLLLERYKLWLKWKRKHA